MVSAVLFITFFVLLVLNVPIAVCLGLSSAAAILYSGTSLTIVATNIYSGISKFLLLAIPFFVLSGNIMAKAGISTRLIRFVDTCVGHRKGGIANVCIIVACFFGAISGSGPATVAALGAVLIPAMVERGGFSAAFSTALMATSSSIAIVIPPSIAFVVYASITGVSIGDMFMAGIIPGILMGLALVVVVMLEVRRNHVMPSNVEKASAKERWNAFKDAFWGFLMPIIILGGIYAGIFTPTESASVACIYALIISVFVFREVNLKTLYKIFADSCVSSAVVLFVVSMSAPFGWFMTTENIPTILSTTIMSIFTNKFVILFVMNLLLLFLGCFLETQSIILLVTPILLPIATALGVSPIALGLIIIVNTSIGMITPPMAVNLFVATGVCKTTIGAVSKKIIKYLILEFCILLLYMYVPIIFGISI